MTDGDKIVRFLLEDEDEDDFESWKDVSAVDHFDVAEEWMRDTLPRLGFNYSPAMRRWEKKRGSAMVDIGYSTKDMCVLMILYGRTQGDRWQNHEMLSVPLGDKAINQLSKWGMLRDV